MRSLLIHGDNLVNSRSFLHQIISTAKQYHLDIRRLDGQKIDLTQLIQATSSINMFATTSLVLIEDLHRLKSKSLFKQVQSHLNSLDLKTNPVVLWESKLLTPTQLKKLSQFPTRIFKTNPLIFKFLDNLKPQNSNPLLQLYHQLLTTDTPELTFYMLMRHLRQLCSIGSPDFKLSPWQLTKLKSQRRLFSDHQLLAFHQNLYRLDIAIKTGRSVFSLKDSLELVLVSL
jgi:hypothetical protein